MHAMILAAGRGQRMRPLTDHTPKPLLNAGGHPLIVWHLRNLAGAGITNIVVNHAWLGAQIEDYLGDGANFGVNIQYSAESPALETAGGIARALPLLGDGPFLVINGDIWCDWDLARASLIGERLDRQPDVLGHLVLTQNPLHHPKGDFTLDRQGHVYDDGSEKLTFCGIGVYQPELFKQVDAQTPTALAPLLRAAIEKKQITGEQHDGIWMDIGTPQRLQALDQRIRERGTIG
jgi:N-acetyl-alpha-D-muramate 1-phosphate uridylyltransferase